MPSTVDMTTRPKPVQRCRKPGHRKHVAGCDACKKYSAYDNRVRRWERENGISHSLVPTGPVREHLIYLINDGGRFENDIAAEVGCTPSTVSRIITGKRGEIFPFTAEALLAVKPAGRPKPPKSDMVPSVEGIRLLQGLNAQGWAWRHIGDQLGGLARQNARLMASGRTQWMFASTRDRIRAVARQLGPYDINQLDTKMPGMDRNAANAAARAGFVPLWRWDPERIADPAAEPLPPMRLVQPTEEAGYLADTAPDQLIDPVVLHHVKATAQKLDETTGQLNRRADAYIRPLAGLTRLEMYITVAYGTQLGMSEADVAELLGYPAADSKEIETGQRAVCRVLEDTRAAQNWIDKHCPGWIPRWFSYRPADGKSPFGPLFTALLALQPAPVGPGWDIAELTTRCGLKDVEMTPLLHRATTIGNRPWAPRVVTAAAASNAA